MKTKTTIYFAVGFVVAIAALWAAETKINSGYDHTFSGGRMIVSAGTESLTLSATNWVDSMVPGMSFRNGASAPALGNLTDANIQALYFDKAADDLVHSGIQLNHNYKEASDIELHAHLFFPTAAAADASTNVWQLAYSWGNIAGVFPSSTTVIVTNSGTVTQYEHRIVSFGTVTGTAKTISSCIAVTLTRVGTSADDIYDADIALVSFDAHYQANSVGSIQQTVK